MSITLHNLTRHEESKQHNHLSCYLVYIHTDCSKAVLKTLTLILIHAMVAGTIPTAALLLTTKIAIKVPTIFLLESYANKIHQKIGAPLQQGANTSHFRYNYISTSN